jgi:hypothetical protein
MIRRTLVPLAVFALAATTSNSLAQDPPKQEAPKQDAVAAVDAPRRFVTVKYVSGGSVRGVLEKGVLWERRDAQGAWVAANAGERGASLRLQYVNGVDGSMVIAGERVKEVVVDGPFTDEHLAKTRDEIAAAGAKAADDRRIAAEKRAAEARAAAEKAKAPPAPATKPGETPPGPPPAADAPPAADSPPVDTLDAATRRRRTELLAKYPPAKWTLETPAEIQKRFIVRHLPATKEEREFIAVFAEWEPAFQEWKKSQPVAPK